MKSETVQKTTLPPHKFNESILVIKKETLFPEGVWNGLKKVDFAHYLELVKKHQEFMPRGLAEENYNYKQVIPYVVFRHNNLYFLMQRKGSSSE